MQEESWYACEKIREQFGERRCRALYWLVFQYYFDWWK